MTAGAAGFAAIASVSLYLARPRASYGYVTDSSIFLQSYANGESCRDFFAWTKTRQRSFARVIAL